MDRLFLFFMVALISGCAPVISKQSLKLVDKKATFEEVKLNPQGNIGKNLLLGGYIARVANTKQGGELEVVQTDMDGDHRPQDTTGSLGRFLARTDKFMDPMVYRVGLPVTLVGEMTGIETKTLFQVEYNYPVVKVKELHLWKEEEQRQRSSPTFHFGFGIGTFF